MPGHLKMIFYNNVMKLCAWSSYIHIQPDDDDDDDDSGLLRARNIQDKR